MCDTQIEKNQAKSISRDKILEKNCVAEVDAKNLVNDSAPANGSFTIEYVNAEPIQNKTLNSPSCETKLRRSQRVRQLLDCYDPANY